MAETKNPLHCHDCGNDLPETVYHIEGKLLCTVCGIKAKRVIELRARHRNLPPGPSLTR